MANHKLYEKTISSEIVFSGNFLEVKKDKVEQHDGKTFSREYLEHPGASLIVPQMPNGELLFIRQFRYALKEVFIEFPAGKRDAAEDYETAAHRELLEETGYKAGALDFMCTLHPVIGYSNERIDCFLAKDLVLETAHCDEGENIELFPLSLTTALDFHKKGKITDAKTIIALLWYEKWSN